MKSKKQHDGRVHVVQELPADTAEALFVPALCVTGRVVLTTGDSRSGQICKDRLKDGGYQELDGEKSEELLFNESKGRVWEDGKILEVVGDDGCKQGEREEHH